MTFGHEKAPASENEGLQNNNVSLTLVPSVARPLDPHVLEQQLEGIYIVVAQIKSPDDSPRTRRRFYANLPSAQRAVDRARMNGKDAHLFIGQISIVDGDPR